MVFLSSKELSVKNGGYLVGNEKPVTHPEFVEAQERAHYLVTLAEKVSKANFTTCKVDSFETLMAEAIQEVNDSTHEYISKKAPTKRKLTEQLKEEARKWQDVQSANTLADRVNEKMQAFNIVKDFEEFGLYFSEGVVKLAKIYTIKEIVEAVKVIDKHLK